MFPFVYTHELGHALYTPNENTQWLKTHTMSIYADCRGVPYQFIQPKSK